MVSPQEWGPQAWELLHGIAERVGRHDRPFMIRDEQNSLRLTLRNFWSLMPCHKCQSHYKSYLQKHPPELFLQQNGEWLRDSLREWLYKLHEEVNERKEIVSNVNIDDLTSRYSSVDLRHEAANLKTVYQRGLQSGVLRADDWKVAWKCLDMLLRFIGV